MPDILEHPEFEKSKPFVIADTLDYVPHSLVIKTIIRKTTGNVNVMSFDAGETLAGKISPFDTFIQVIDGNAEILIDDQSSALKVGQCIIIPAHSRSTIKASVRLKVLSTIIKSGYEEAL